jgi:D-aspartate ligase
MPRVIVVGCGMAGLAVIRALAGSDDIELVAMTHTLQEIGCVSRHVTSVIKCPHPGREEAAFIDFLLQHGPHWHGSLLIEAGDYMAVAISKHKAVLATHYKTSLAEWPVVQRFIEKDQLYALCRECDVPCPATFQLGTMTEVDAVAAKATYPCILKPVNSAAFVSRFNRKNFLVADATALKREFQRCAEAQLSMVVQEIIPGGDNALERLQTYVNSQGRMSARFFSNKLRQHPPQFGVMRVGYSTARNAEAEQLAERLLQHGNYRGYANVEFKRDARDGRLKLIEVNVRMPRGGMLAVACGVNFPQILYADLMRNEQRYVEDYVRDLYWIELLPDLLNMTLNPYGEKRYSWRENLAPYFSRKKVFADWNWRDVRPFLRHLRNGFSRLSGAG